MADSLDTLLEVALTDSFVGSPQDSLLVAVHACLLSAGYALVGTGDENFGVESSKPSDVLASSSHPGLPRSWNSSQDVYALQYKHEATQQLCLIKALLMEGQLLVNAMAACNTSEVCTVSLELSKYIKEGSDRAFNSLSIFKNLLQLMTVLSKELEAKLSQFCTKTAVSLPSPSASSKLPDVAASTRPTIEEGLGDDPLRIGPPRQPSNPNPLRDIDPLLSGPFGYGDADRLPVGRMVGPRGGGMIYDPLRQGGRMGGGIPGFGPQGPYPPTHPPGARYDPVYPIGPGQRPAPPGRPPARGFGEPDPDHLPPPGYNDDMFS